MYPPMESLAARDSAGTSTPGRYFPDNTPWASGDQTIYETSFAALSGMIFSSARRHNNEYWG